MEKPDPLPYSASGRVRKSTLLSVIGLASGAAAVSLFVVIVQVVEQRYLRIQMSTLKSIVPVLGFASLILNITSLTTSAVAIMRRRGPLQIFSASAALLYWIVIALM